MDGIEYIRAEIKRVSALVNSKKTDDSADCPFSEGRVQAVPEPEKKPAPKSFQEFMEKLKPDDNEGD